MKRLVTALLVLILGVGLVGTSAALAIEDPPEYSSQITSLSKPYDIAMDSEGNIYVADTYNDRIQKYTPDCTLDTTWGEIDNEGNYTGTVGGFYWPQGIAVDSDKNVYVSDTNNQCIKKFDANGVLDTSNDIDTSGWGEIDNDGNYTGTVTTGEDSTPTGIAVDIYGNIYVADSQNNCIMKFNSTGVLVATWGEYGQFSWPVGVAVDSLGNIYVADSGNNRIQKLEIDENDIITGFITWGEYGTENGYFDGPYGVAVDDENNVYVADAYNNRIQIFDSAGTYITQWGEYGTENGLFYRPYGVEVNSAGNVCVADKNNNRVQIFTPVTGDLDSDGDGYTDAEEELYGSDKDNSDDIPETLAVDELVSMVMDCNDNAGIVNSLDSKLQNVLDALEAANSGLRQDAINKLEAFVSACETQSDRIDQVDLLIEKANQIITSLLLG